MEEEIIIIPPGIIIIILGKGEIHKIIKTQHQDQEEIKLLHNDGKVFSRFFVI